MDRGERRHRTERIIHRRVQSRIVEAGGPPYTPLPLEPWGRRFLYRVAGGGRTYWTFHAWLAKPGILRKGNGAHGCCGVCDHEENPKRGEPSLAWELDQLREEEAIPARSLDRPGSPKSCRRRSRKDTKRWCRGRVGVLHLTEWRPTHPGFDNYELVCTTCGKKLDWCFQRSLVAKKVSLSLRHVVRAMDQGLRARTGSSRSSGVSGKI